MGLGAQVGPPASALRSAAQRSSRVTVAAVGWALRCAPAPWRVSRGRAAGAVLGGRGAGGLAAGLAAAMAPVLRGLPQRVLWLLLAHHIFMVTACQEATYGTIIRDLCLSRFKKDMEAIGRPLWCDWGKTISHKLCALQEQQPQDGSIQTQHPGFPTSSKVWTCHTPAPRSEEP